MTVSGMLLLGGFVLFAVLMVVRLLPALLALPLMAAWIAWVAGLPFLTWANEVLLGGAMRLSSAIALVVFGSMFARVIQKTGISSAIIKKAAELAGDRPIAIGFLMLAATAFVFMGMSGLGAVLMVGSIALPIMTSSGISPLDAAVILLLGINLGLIANIASYGTYIGIFGSEAALYYYFPGIAIAALVAIAYVLRNVPRGTGGEGSLLDLALSVIRGILSVPFSLVHVLGNLLSRKPTELVRKRKELPPAALVAPILPLVFIGIAGMVFGLGSPKTGAIDPVAAAILGFLLAAAYASLVTRPGQTINLLAGAFVEGIQDVAGVLFLFIGIGMLVTATAHPLAAPVLNPLLTAILPSSLTGLLIVFALFAPAALYRGPFNMYGMGAGIAAILMGFGTFPPEALCGMFLAVGFVQVIADPTNSHNTWIGGFTGVDTAVILRRILPYSWAMCILMLLCVAVTH
ncbi:MAG: transporter [Selenomonadaceae bacterium]|nr:transporter [Selenomonadaceae bacterium]MBR6343221.1 transporter [Selenomonadaceae bacterium]